MAFFTHLKPIKGYIRISGNCLQAFTTNYPVYCKNQSPKFGLTFAYSHNLLKHHERLMFLFPFSNLLQ